MNVFFISDIMQKTESHDSTGTRRSWEIMEQVLIPSPLNCEIRHRIKWVLWFLSAPSVATHEGFADHFRNEMHAIRCSLKSFINK